MTKQNIVVSIGQALQVLEHFPGEVFDSDKFAIFDISLSEFQQNSVELRNYKKMICAISFCGGRYPDLDLAKFDVVLVLDEEVIDHNNYLQKLRKKFNNHNIVIVCSGYHKHYPPDTDSVYVYPYFLQSILKHNVPKIVDSIGCYQRTFDVLLGGTKRHKKFIFDRLGQHCMLDACYVNLTTHTGSPAPVKTIYRSPEIDSLEDSALSNIIDTQVFNSHVQLESGTKISQIVPWNIYQNSLYSLIAETNFENYFFFTEKTAKALYGQRPFVFFGAQGQLEDLRNLGFATFSDVIDESYDSILDPTERFTKAFEQVRWLFDQNHQLLHQRLQPIVEHNCAHIQNRQYFLKPLKQWLNKYF
jgi:hypothetical protein